MRTAMRKRPTPKAAEKETRETIASVLGELTMATAAKWLRPWRGGGNRVCLGADSKELEVRGDGLALGCDDRLLCIGGDGKLVGWGCECDCSDENSNAVRFETPSQELRL